MASFRVFALIPAGGKSKRMGRPKLALPLGEKTVLEHVLSAVDLPATTDVVVVFGPHLAHLTEMAERGGAHALVLEEATADMRATIEYGLAWIEKKHQPSADDFILLLPGDFPAVTRQDVQRVIDEAARYPDHTIFVATHNERRGHPVLIQWKHAAAIRAFAPGQGLNVYLRSKPEETLEVAVGANVLRDLDTPDDYEQLLKDY